VKAFNPPARTHIAKRPTKEEDPNYNPTDARYNTIRWNTNDQVSYGAIGPSRVDPRTGEIIDADILFEHNIVANFGKSYRRLPPRAALMQVDGNLKQLWMTDEERAKENAFFRSVLQDRSPTRFVPRRRSAGLGAEIMRLSMLGRRHGGGRVWWSRVHASPSCG
jgi:hypothetical protein